LVIPGCLDTSPYTFGNLQRYLVVGPRQNDDKLFATIAPDEVSVSQPLIRRRCDTLKDIVADIMAVSIIYGFEMVDVK
jgi:hypothetical protein